MKYLYVMGLEHSGTTLLSHLVGSRHDAMSLGEVMPFLWAKHMTHYASRWGDKPDYGYCSCGARWQACPFWGPRYGLCGLESAGSQEEKYSAFLASLAPYAPTSQVLVDTSKTFVHFDALNRAWGHSGLGAGNLLAVLITKDPRGFLFSMAAKAKQRGRRTGLLSHWRTLSLWYGANRELYRTIEGLGEKRALSITYEDLCFAPEQTVGKLCDMIGLARPKGGLTPDHNESHIILGNTGFLRQTRNAIRYDDRWFHSSLVQLAYLMHPRARRLNQELAARSQADAVRAPSTS